MCRRPRAHGAPQLELRPADCCVQLELQGGRIVWNGPSPVRSSWSVTRSPAARLLLLAREPLDAALARDQHDVRAPDEQAGLDDAGDRSELRVERGRVF